MSQPKGFISDADFEKKIGFAEKPPGFISDDEFEKQIATPQSQNQEMSFGDAAKIAGQNLTGGLKAFGRGAVEGASNVGRGIEQLVLQGAEKTGLLPEGTEKSYRKNIVEPGKVKYESLPYIKEHNLMAGIGELAGEVGATAPAGAISLPAKVIKVGAKVIPKAAKIISGKTVQNIGSGTVQGAASGFMQYDPTGESRLFNTGLGGLIGGGLTGAVLGGKRIIRGKDTPEARAKTAELSALSKEHGVDLTVPELRGSVGGKYAEGLVEKIPLTGYIKTREKQLGQFQKRAEELKQQIGGDIPDNYGSALKGSLQERLKNNKKIVGQKFDRVEKISEQQGGKVPFNNTQQEAQKIFDELVNVPEQFVNKSLVNDVLKFANLENLPFGTARKLRSQLGDEVSKLKKAANTGAVSAEEYRMTTRLFSSLEKDIDEFADKSGGALKQAYKEAQQEFKEKIVPFKNGPLSKYIDPNSDNDLVVGAFLKPDRPELASQLINNVDDKGLTAARAAILNDAYTDAMQGEFFNPQRFVKRALELGKTNKVLFTDAQRKSLEGYSKLAKAAERASKFAANPETGARLVGPLGAIAAGTAIVMKPAMAALIGTGIGLSHLMTSDLGRKLLVRASNLPEKGAEKLWKKLLMNATKVLGPVIATSPSAPQESELE